MDNASRPSYETALEAVARGYTPIAIKDPVPGNPKLKGKSPLRSNWQHTRWDPKNRQEVIEHFREAAEEGAHGVGLVLGEPSGGLVDVDLDHPLAMRLRTLLLPHTFMISGRTTRPFSHYWYIVEGTLPGYRKYTLPPDPTDDDPERSTIVELRTQGNQTVIPPTIHESGDTYHWEIEPWGGDPGPSIIENGRVLSVQVAFLALTCILMDKWPQRGGRHEAYLALAGGLLRLGETVHPFWERNAAKVIGNLALGTHDEDGPEERQKEALRTTLDKLRQGKPAVGWPKLAEIIGEPHVDAARRMVREIEGLASPAKTKEWEEQRRVFGVEWESRAEPIVEEPDPESDDPYERRNTSWGKLDLEPFLTGTINLPEPTVLVRDDGLGLMYQGRVNYLYGASEQGKTWVALHACIQEMRKSERVLYIDFEDEPNYTIARLKQMGMEDEDIKSYLTYVHPEEPIQDMLNTLQWGRGRTDERALKASVAFQELLDEVQPTLIVIDAAMEVFSAHELDPNKGSDIAKIQQWLYQLTRRGKCTVIILDHVVKNPHRGIEPTGGGHKKALTSGAMFQVNAIDPPLDGHVGQVELILMKDRISRVNIHSTFERGRGRTILISGIVVVDSTVPDKVSISIRPDKIGPNEMHIGESHGEVIAASEKATKKVAESLKQQQITRAVEQIFSHCFHDDLAVELSRSEIDHMLRQQWPELYSDLPDEDLQVLTHGALRAMTSEDGLGMLEMFTKPGGEKRGGGKWAVYRLPRPRPAEES